jgi:AcrR family transcriptional regulator
MQAGGPNIGPVTDAPCKPSLRATNRQRTEQQILDAATELVGHKGEMGFTMPEVAERSGVALRTLYRYFRTKQDLVDALATVADQVDAVAVPDRLEDFEEWLVAAWRNLLKVEPFLRAQHQGPAGDAVRRSRLARHRAMTNAIIERHRPDLSPAARDDLADQALLLASSTALFELIDVIGTEPERAARLSARAIVTLVRNAPAAVET